MAAYRRDLVGDLRPGQADLSTTQIYTYIHRQKLESLFERYHLHLTRFEGSLR